MKKLSKLTREYRRVKSTNTKGSINKLGEDHLVKLLMVEVCPPKFGFPTSAVADVLI